MSAGQDSEPEVRIYWQDPDGRYRYRAAVGERDEFALSDPDVIAWVVDVAKYVGSAAVGGIIGNRADASLRAMSRRVAGMGPGDRYIAHTVARQAIQREFGETISAAPVYESVTEDGRELHFDGGEPGLHYEVQCRHRPLGGTRAVRVTRDDAGPEARGVQ